MTERERKAQAGDTAFVSFGLLFVVFIVGVWCGAAGVLSSLSL